MRDVLEYRIEDRRGQLDRPEDLDWLNELGEANWKLRFAIPIEIGWRLVFSREAE